MAKLNNQLNAFDKKLYLDSQSAQNIYLRTEEKIGEHKLENTLDHKIDFQRVDSIDTQESSLHVQEVFTEINKEGSVLTINSESTTEVNKALQRITARESKDYQSASKKVNRYLSPSLTRTKRRAQNLSPQIERLTTQEKKAVKRYYEQFLYLNQQKEPLNTKLKIIENNNIPNSQIPEEKNCLICKEVVNALSKINWEGEELSLFNKNKRAWRKTDNPPKESQVTATWGNIWNRNHPYNVFYSEESKFKQAVKKIINSRKKYYDTINSPSWRLCGLTIRWIGATCGYEAKNAMEQSIQDASAEIELQIGSQLLHWMNQIDSKSLISA